MAEYAEEHIEKLGQVPLVQDPTVPLLSSDDDDAAGSVVVLEGEPGDREVPAFDLATRTWKGLPASTVALPTIAPNALLATDASGTVMWAKILTDAGSGNVIVDALSGDVILVPA